MPDLFRLAWRSFHVPKAGNTLDEYEDAFAGDPDRGRFAIADGASESAFANAWAQIVVEAFAHTPGPWSRWLDAARQRWCTQVHERDLPWYAEAKFEEGAYAAMLGIAFHDGRWHARAVGDCCLFQVRGHRLLRAFPIHHSRDFGSRPSLLGSRRRQAAQPRTRRIRAKGGVCPGDVFVLMTDALAHWFLQQVEKGQQPWNDLQSILAEYQFSQFTNDLRAAEELRNDDATLVLIEPNS